MKCAECRYSIDEQTFPHILNTYTCTFVLFTTEIADNEEILCARKNSGYDLVLCRMLIVVVAVVVVTAVANAACWSLVRSINPTKTHLFVVYLTAGIGSPPHQHKIEILAYR